MRWGFVHGLLVGGVVIALLDVVLHVAFGCQPT